MKIEKTDCNYQVTECDLKFGEQITLDGELLIPISSLDKIRAEIEPTRKMYLEMNDIDWLNGCDYVLSVLDKYKAESEG